MQNCNFQTLVLILVVRWKKNQFSRSLLPYIWSRKFTLKVLLFSCILGWSITVSRSQENLREFDREFLKFCRCFEENPSMIFWENKVIFKIFHSYTVSQFLQLNVCPFMLREYQPTVAEDCSYRISWSAMSVLAGFAFLWLCSYNASIVMFLEKDFVVLRQETGMFAVSCVSLTIFPVYSSRKMILFSFLDVYFLRILLVLPHSELLC